MANEMEAHTNSPATLPVVEVPRPAGARPAVAVEAVVPAVVVTPPPPTPRLLTGEEDDELDTRQRYEISGSAFRKRIDRDRRSLLKDLAGTDDIEAVKARLRRAEELEASEEQQRRNAMAAEERLREDLSRSEQARQAAEARAEQIAQERQVDRESERVRQIATRYVDPEYVDDIVWGQFKRHLATLPESELESFDDSAIAEWFEEFVSTRPKFAKDVVAAKVSDATVARVPVTNGVRADHRPAPLQGVAASEKTARPGQPNSMSKAEIKSKFGYSW